MAENDPIIPSPVPPVQPEVPVATPTVPTMPPLPTPPQEVGKKSNTGLLVILAVVVIALLVLGGVTFFALQGGQTETVSTAPTPTPRVSATPTPDPNSDRTGDIKKDLDQTTVTDPSTEVDQLTTEVNKL